MGMNEFYKMLLRSGGLKGIEKAEKALKDLKEESTEPWKKSVFSLLEDAVGEYGVEGIKMVENAVEKALSGVHPDISFASLKARSDFLAAMQNMEADDKKKTEEFFQKLGHAMGAIIKAIIAVVAR